jgi:hypothetical protein
MNAPLTAQSRITTPLGPMTLAATAHGLAGAWFAPPWPFGGTTGGGQPLPGASHA